MRLSSVYLQTIQNQLDKIANNLANSVTPGFKQQLLSWEESYDRQDRANTVAQYGGLPLTGSPVLKDNLYVGKRYDFNQGSLTSTDNKWDLAIMGEGFFQVRTGNGQLGYTRAGIFMVDSEGNIVNNRGMCLEPPVIIPANAYNISVDENGIIRGSLPNDDEDIDDYTSDFTDDEDGADNVVIFGQIPLFKFVNPDGLAPVGDNIFLPTESSGQPQEGTAGQDGYGIIKSSMLESSNVDLVNNMTSLIQMQRAYQFKLQLIKDRSEMSSVAISMRG
ncbi:MAG: flagellar hook-basal body complex protein [Peptococcaceae bacterium]|nr:flagellar hook-basal body complex protein [Peptococcaceae bacterium]